MDRARPLVAVAACAACALLSSALPGCALFSSSKAEAPKQPEAPPPDTTVELNGDELVRTFDLNHDGRPDDWKHYKLIPSTVEGQKPREVLIQRELDTNFDGKVDLVTWFNEDGTRAKEMFDLDFDGKFDVVDTYEKGVLTKKETFHGQVDKPDTVAFYEGGKKVRVERDTHGEGRPDTWEYFENGKLSRIGEDVDGDGLVDRWVKSKEPDEGDQPQKPAGKK
jgi:hypothetical protein